MKRPTFVNNEIYHIYNRGVEKRNIFLDNLEYSRFIHDLYEFNDRAPAISSNVRLSSRRPSQCLEVRLPNIERSAKPRKLLVNILAFCLMPNHFHLLIRQCTNNGTVNFMQKLGTGYTNFFNLRHKRVGPLFQGKFKAILIKNPVHFMYLPYYIHTNPLDIVMPTWREKRLKDSKQAMRFLENYRWSSFPDYLGDKNFPSVTQRGLIRESVGGPQRYRNSTIQWLKDMHLAEIEDIILE